MQHEINLSRDKNCCLVRHHFNAYDISTSGCDKVRLTLYDVKIIFSLLFLNIARPEGILYSYFVGCCPLSEPILGSPLPNKSDIGQAVDQTTVLLFPPRILVYVSLTIIRDNYFKNYKPVHLAQLKKSSFNSQTFQWRSISKWFDQQGVE